MHSHLQRGSIKQVAVIKKNNNKIKIFFFLWSLLGKAHSELFEATTPGWGAMYMEGFIQTEPDATSLRF